MLNKLFRLIVITLVIVSCTACQSGTKNTYVTHQVAAAVPTAQVNTAACETVESWGCYVIENVSIKDWQYKMTVTVNNGTSVGIYAMRGTITTSIGVLDRLPIQITGKKEVFLNGNPQLVGFK